MFDEASCGFLVEFHRPLFRLCLQRFDLLEVLLYPRQLPKHGMFFSVHSMKTEIG